MAPENAQSDARPPLRVTYQSYLLRVRRVVEGENETRQVYLQSIPGHDEKYFRSLCDLVAYLRLQTGLQRKNTRDANDTSGGEV